MSRLDASGRGTGFRPASCAWGPARTSVGRGSGTAAVVCETWAVEMLPGDAVWLGRAVESPGLCPRGRPDGAMDSELALFCLRTWPGGSFAGRSLRAARAASSAWAGRLLSAFVSFAGPEPCRPEPWANATFAWTAQRTPRLKPRTTCRFTRPISLLLTLRSVLSQSRRQDCRSPTRASLTRFVGQD
jgi:hypothetical protein